MMSTWNYENPEIDAHQTPTNFQREICTLKLCKYEVLTTKNPGYLPLVEERSHSVTENRTRNLCVGRQLEVPL